MKCLDLTLPTPAENLACDEALLDWCEDQYRGDVLRFWEPREYFVVVGYANKVAREVNTTACAASGIPVYRRCSGGGAVLQGPGCLNYTLVLKIAGDTPLGNIASANRFIMERNRAALAGLFSKLETRPAATARQRGENPKPEIEHCGHTDLAIGGLKFSGNAQRRRKRCLLFHGTFLVHFDIPLIDRVLPLPSKEPDYRRHRAHAMFLTNLAVPGDSVKRALQDAWRAAEPVEFFPRARIESLARDKYVTKEWNFKF